MRSQICAPIFFGNELWLAFLQRHLEAKRKHQERITKFGRAIESIAEQESKILEQLVRGI